MGTEWKSVSVAAKNLIRSMMTLKPDLRISVEKALEHPWITGKTNLPVHIPFFQPSLRSPPKVPVIANSPNGKHSSPSSRSSPSSTHEIIDLTNDSNSGVASPMSHKHSMLPPKPRTPSPMSLPLSTASQKACSPLQQSSMVVSIDIINEPQDSEKSPPSPPISLPVLIEKENETENHSTEINPLQSDIENEKCQPADSDYHEKVVEKCEETPMDDDNHPDSSGVVVDTIDTASNMGSNLGCGKIGTVYWSNRAFIVGQKKAEVIQELIDQSPVRNEESSLFAKVTGLSSSSMPASSVGGSNEVHIDGSLREVDDDIKPSNSYCLKDIPCSNAKAVPQRQSSLKPFSPLVELNKGSSSSARKRRIVDDDDEDDNAVDIRKIDDWKNDQIKNKKNRLQNNENEDIDEKMKINHSNANSSRSETSSKDNPSQVIFDDIVEDDWSPRKRTRSMTTRLEQQNGSPTSHPNKSFSTPPTNTSNHPVVEPFASAQSFPSRASGAGVFDVENSVQSNDPSKSSTSSSSSSNSSSSNISGFQSQVKTNIKAVDSIATVSVNSNSGNRTSQLDTFSPLHHTRKQSAPVKNLQNSKLLRKKVKTIALALDKRPR